ncbi:MAG TPA: hypothetical protein VGW36_08480 [Pyrinomonadaceae bacterium]|nr:hypothetical protein [Pyrinomonadaceae bacterium]
MLPDNQNMEMNVEKQHRTLLILWVAFLMSIVMYLFIAVVLPRPEEPVVRPLAMALSFASAFLTVVSFGVKKKFVSNAISQQNPQLVTKGFILAAAMCEAAALLGLLDLFIARDRNYWTLIAIALLGMLVNFPRRSHLVSANFKPGM